MKATRHYFVTGKVQGVGYRRFVQKRAEALGLHGWTRNLNDGRVEVCVVGAISLLDDLKSELERGPAFSVVENVEMREGKPLETTGFEIHPDGDPI